MSSKSSIPSFLRRLFLVAVLAFFAGALTTSCALYLDDDYQPPPRETWPEECWDCEGIAPDAGGQWDCQEDAECAAGCYCSDINWCEESGFCDAQTPCSSGFECDDRGTCVPETPEPTQTCQSDVFCDLAAPICPVASTPIIENGCYTGACMAKADCPDGAPFACSDYNDMELACVATSSCVPVYKGVNCTSDVGTSCESGSNNCTCETFELDRCDAIEP